jgi:hypothetical protein
VAWLSIYFQAKWVSSFRVAFNCQVDRTPNPSTSIPCTKAARASKALKMKKQVAAVPLFYKVRVVEKSRPVAVTKLRKRPQVYQIIARALHF